MPIAAFRAWVGFAKANTPTYMTAAPIATATTINVPTGNSVPASTGTIYIIDGANSETRAVTAGGGTTALTVAALTYGHPVGTPIYWQLTASVGPADYMPVTAFPDAADTIATVADTGIRGSNVSSYGVTQVAGESDIKLAGDVIPDTFGYLLGSVFGAVDSGGAGPPQVHTFAGMNTAASNGQPTELMVWVYNGNNCRLFVGAKASDVTITYDPMQLLKWTATFKGFLSGVVTTPSNSFSGIGPQGAWQASATIGGTLITNLLTASITISRASITSIQTLDGNQSPYKIWAGPLQCAGTLDTVMEDDTVLLNYIKNTQPAVVLTLTNGSGGTQVGLTVQMTKCNFVAGWKPGDKGGYVNVSGPITPVANLTDANTAGGGYSPARVVLTNTKTYGTYQ